MTIQCTFPYIVYAILICIDLNFIKVALFPSVLIKRLARLHQGVIGMIRPGISNHSYVGIPALSGTGHLLFVAFAISSFHCQCYMRISSPLSKWFLLLYRPPPLLHYALSVIPCLTSGLSFWL